MLRALKRSAGRKSQARLLCTELIARAREPVFFLQFAVPDTMDGRFDLVALHAWLAIDHLESDSPLRQALIDEIFVSFDEALRALGTGDVGMNRRLKTMAGAFYGRLQAYREADGAEALADAIHRNLYRGKQGSGALAHAVATYATAARSHLANDHSRLDFGPLPHM